MTSDRKQPGAAFWATVALVVVLAMYPVAWGPWIWFEITHSPADEIRAVGNGAFAPLEWLGRHHLLPDFYVEYLEKFAVAALKAHS